MNTLLAILIIAVTAASAIPSPNYAACVEVENATFDTVQADVTYSNGVTTSADIGPGAVRVFAPHVVDHGSHRTVVPVETLVVSMDRPYVGRLELTHQIQVTGVHNCVRRVVRPNLGGAYIE